MLTKARRSYYAAKPLQMLVKTFLLDAHKRSWGSLRAPGGVPGDQKPFGQPLPSRRYGATTLSAYSLAHMSLVSNGVLGAAMKCLACGAEMRLSDVRTDTTRPFAIERRIFQCSSCRQTAQRLGFDRSGLPDCTSPAMKTYAPAIRLQSDRPEAAGALGHAGEKLINREVAATPQKSVDWGSVVGKVSITLKAQAREARAATWARTMEKLRSRQMALKERTATVDACDTTREGGHRNQHQGLMRTGASQGA